MNSDNRIIVIKLSDRYAQFGWMTNLSVDIQGSVPLYLGFGQNEIFLLNEKAFTEIENSIPLMKSENQLNDLLNERIIYPRPCSHEKLTSLTARSLWCVVMIQLISISLSKLENMKYNPIGFVVSYPDNIDASLKQMIINAVHHCDNILNQNMDELRKDKQTIIEEEFKDFYVYNQFVETMKKYKNKQLRGMKQFEFKVVPNSRGISERIVYEEFRGMITKTISTNSDVYKTQLVGVVDYGFNSTEFYLILVRDKTAVVVGKRKIDIGMNIVYQRLLKIIEGRENDDSFIVKPFEQWERSYKQNWKENKSAFVGFSVANLSETYFITSSSDKKRIERERISKMIHNENAEICKMIHETIEETSHQLKNLKEFELDGHILKLENVPFTKCLFNSEVKNIFLMEMLRNNGIDCDDTNDVDNFILKGCVYYSRSLFSRMTNSDDQTLIADEITVCELIQPNRFVIEYEKEIISTFPEKPMLSNEMMFIGNEFEKVVEYKVYDTFNSNDPNERFYIGKFELQNKGNVYLQLNKYLSNLVPRIEYGDIRQQYDELNYDLIFVEEEVETDEENIIQFIDNGVIKEEIESFGIYPMKTLQIIKNINDEYQRSLGLKRQWENKRKAIDKSKKLDIKTLQEDFKQIVYVTEKNNDEFEERINQYFEKFEKK